MARRFWPGQLGDRKVSAAPARRCPRRSRRTAARDGDRRCCRHPVEQLGRRPRRAVRLSAAGAKRRPGPDMTGQMSIVARRRGEASLAAAMATMVQDIDQRLVLARAESLADSIALGLTPQRVLATVSGVMGLVALLLASMGIYGVTAYTVALRRQEFAIRLALGAPRARVVRMVFRQGTWLVAVGLASASRARSASGRSFPSSSTDCRPLTCQLSSGRCRSSSPSARRRPSCRRGRPFARAGGRRFNRSERKQSQPRRGPNAS